MAIKTILIIGKTGQLASALLEYVKGFPDFSVIARGKEELDILDGNSIESVIREAKPDIVINTASWQIMAQCEASPRQALAMNFVAVRNLAAVCKDNNASLVHFSSDAVFSGHQDEFRAEDDLPDPLQMFGLSKLAGEYAVLAVYPKGAYILRTCGLYGGLTGSPAKCNFVLNMLKEAAESKEAIEVSSEQIVSPTYAVDLAKATYGLLALNPAPGVYHLVNEGCCSWADFAKEIFALAEVKKEVRGVDRGGYSGNADRPRFSALKNTKAKALGVALPNWQDGLKRYFDFLRANGGLK